MNKVLHRFGLVAVLTSSVTFGANPAGAQGAVAFVGSASIACFGCGVSDCDASLTVAGEVDVTPTAGGAVTTTCTANEPSDVTCVITGSASGRVEGAVNVDFNWTRVGATVVISTAGDINGNGVAVFHFSPVVKPCGNRIAADVAGALVGA